MNAPTIAAYAPLFYTNSLAFALSLVTMFYFVIFHLTPFAPGEVAMPRIVYALAALFGTFLSTGSCSIILCCAPRRNGPVDDGELVAYVLLNALALAAYIAALILMFNPMEPKEHAGGSVVFEWSVTLVFLDILLDFVAITRALIFRGHPRCARREKTPQASEMM